MLVFSNNGGNGTTIDLKGQETVFFINLIVISTLQVIGSAFNHLSQFSNMMFLFFTFLFTTSCAATGFYPAYSINPDQTFLTHEKDLLHNAPLAQAEQIFDTERNKVRKIALQKLFRTSIGLPSVRIGICWSGGGSRSVVAGVGFLNGLKEIAVLDGCNYISSLSGGCHGLLAWLLSRLPVDLFTQKLIRVQTRGLRYLTHPGHIAKMIARMINQTLIKPFDPQFDKRKITDLPDLVSPFFHPYPFFTSISRFGRKEKKDYHWYTFSPDEIRIYSPDHATFSMLPELLGSEFSNGVVTKKKPPLSLTRLSTFVSSFLPESISLSIPNPFYQLDGYEYGNTKRSTLRDAGWHYNLPLLPLLDPQRDVDLIIIMDAGKTPMEDLEYALTHLAQKYHLTPWSEALKKEIQKRPIVHLPATSVNGTDILYVSITPDEHVREDDGTPYNPRDFKKNPHCKTTNFSYSEKQAFELVARMYQTVVMRKGAFMYAIKEAAQRRYKRTLIRRSQ